MIVERHPASAAALSSGGERGRATRNRLMAAAARLCSERRSLDVSVAEIAREAGVFPNQVTYHFGSKDSLLLQAAFLVLLQETRRVERIGRQAPDAGAFRRNISRAVLALPALPLVAKALATGVAKPELAPVVDHHLHLLFRQSERFLRQQIDGRGWSTARPLEAEARTFWSTALGAALLSRAGVDGTADDLDLAGVLSVRDGAELPG
ncbi:TetR/AcrR family transcriptional regulator C-terminal domain-containing protein [Arthrobacter sp. Y-9]|uniref:TetR/AcrR family transcriptional regulator C-terminal domain-containing protein n=1 Tax=Arthrobacter sp. Y-9 TaxID=3039385 RepID=UPI00241F050F|nr:TetR/AcrR family transcriptional regulator C-terminal domain-containing protein [Arthrobacter sp. Y-9]WFR82941.1 TetR/AcrR family transcriptional regulator C-terminal domain-containing protein [Arthrobacter sp. Y-9]